MFVSWAGSASVVLYMATTALRGERNVTLCSFLLVACWASKDRFLVLRVGRLNQSIVFDGSRASVVFFLLLSERATVVEAWKWASLAANVIRCVFTAPLWGPPCVVRVGVGSGRGRPSLLDVEKSCLRPFESRSSP